MRALVAIALALGLAGAAGAADRKGLQEQTMKELSAFIDAHRAKQTESPPPPPPAAAPAPRPAPTPGGRVTSARAQTGRANVVSTGTPPPAASGAAVSAGGGAVITADEAAAPAEEPAPGPGVELITGGGGVDGTARVGRLPVIE
jgi:hypothetical protein